MPRYRYTLTVLSYSPEAMETDRYKNRIRYFDDFKPDAYPMEFGNQYQLADALNHIANLNRIYNLNIVYDVSRIALVKVVKERTLVKTFTFDDLPTLNFSDYGQMDYIGLLKDIFGHCDMTNEEWSKIKLTRWDILKIDGMLVKFRDQKPFEWFVVLMRNRGVTFAAIAKMLNCSTERVRQRLVKGLRLLRHPHRSKAIRPDKYWVSKA